MTSYKRLKGQVERLSKLAQAAKAREIVRVIAQVREMVATYDLTPEQAGFNEVKAVAPAPKAAKAAGKRDKAPPKYRDPKTGQTWNGVGKRPKFIVNAGADVSKFLISEQSKAAQAQPEAAQPKKAAAKKKPKKSATRSAAAKKAAAKPAAAPKQVSGVTKAPVAKKAAAKKTGPGKKKPAKKQPAAKKGTPGPAQAAESQA